MGQRWLYNIAVALCLLDNQLHTLRVCNNYYFPRHGGYTNTSRCYVVRTLPLLFKLMCIAGQILLYPFRSCRPACAESNSLEFHFIQCWPSHLATNWILVYSMEILFWLMICWIRYANMHALSCSNFYFLYSSLFIMCYMCGWFTYFLMFLYCSCNCSF